MDERRLVVTIGRQYGSGGAEIGAKLAKDLGLDVYDKNILRMNSNQSGIKESYFHLADERAGSKLLYKIVAGLTPEMKAPSFGSDLITADNLFRFQSEVIRRLAQAQNCVIIGRCADMCWTAWMGWSRSSSTQTWMPGSAGSRRKAILPPRM